MDKDIFVRKSPIVTVRVNGEIVSVIADEIETSGGGIDEVCNIVIKGHYTDPLQYHLYCAERMKEYAYKKIDLAVKRVVFNPPATIVLWEDGTKTVVKCDSKDIYDKEKGLALCFMKKALGNTSRTLNDILHREIPEEAAP